MLSSQEQFTAAYGHLPLRVQTLLLELPQHNGKISAAIVAEIVQGMGVSQLDEAMVALLPLAALYAHPPVSNFRVGAVAACLSAGAEYPNLYLGANMEFAGEALSFTVHAEQAAITNAWLHGERGVTAVAISAAPCGYCRQFLNELVTAQTLSIILPPMRVNPLNYFLPDAFGPRDLGISGGLMQSQSHGLELDTSDVLAQAALAAANASYAPYTRNFSGVAIQLSDGAIYSGRYAENAAYNPSMSPLESAISFANTARPFGAHLEITRAVLVEAVAKVSQRVATEAVLSALAPGVRLEYFPVETNPS